MYIVREGYMYYFAYIWGNFFWIDMKHVAFAHKSLHIMT